MPRDRKLDDLSPPMKPKAIEFLARCTEVGVLVMIVETKRSAELHEQDLANGRSWVHGPSLHQDGSERDKPYAGADAMDVCPFLTWNLHGEDKLQWDDKDPVWEVIARIAESCGLHSGYRWQQRDCGHVELETA